ncbi:ATP-dependent DNA helicase [Nephila pilipes]|uniref:ATP-dependent DNA helicase n=1 Tax=Nephila pilipes TaxID=299642 RepID=A0A8X6PS32_NEPPI|nr:ATP-dependent DNA helicase [Nephila pilipes]
MPTKRKGANLSRDTNKSSSIRNRRAQRTEKQVQEENTGARVRMAQLRQEQLDDTRAERNEVMRLEQRQSHRFTINRRRANDQQRQQAHLAFVATSFLRLAFQYEPDIEYYAHSKVLIGAMDKECSYCHALKFKNEPAGMCCASGKVQLPETETPPEPLNGLLIGTDPDSNVS